MKIRVINCEDFDKTYHLNDNQSYEDIINLEECFDYDFELLDEYDETLSCINSYTFGNNLSLKRMAIVNLFYITKIPYNISEDCFEIFENYLLASKIELNEFSDVESFYINSQRRYFGYFSDKEDAGRELLYKVYDMEWDTIDALDNYIDYNKMCDWELIEFNDFYYITDENRML